jgi:endonuclease/exonuclease/phosphatase (EEP) superfamily protein YafD
MRPQYQQAASPAVREQIEALLAKGTASARAQCQDLAWSYGVDLPAPPTPISDRIAALKAAGDMREINRLYTLQGANFEAEQEQRNLVRWTAMRKWAAEPSREESAAADMKRAADAVREAEIEARAMAIVAAENAAALEKARKQARKEIEARK